MSVDSVASVSVTEGTGGINPLSLLFRAFFFGDAEVFFAGVEDAEEAGESEPSSTICRRAGGNGDRGIAFEKGEPGCLHVSLSLLSYAVAHLEIGARLSLFGGVLLYVSLRLGSTPVIAYDLPFVVRPFAVLSGLARFAGLYVSLSPQHTSSSY
jgi:hypothetical protein